jgi:hypothetical protein
MPLSFNVAQDVFPGRLTYPDVEVSGENNNA